MRDTKHAVRNRQHALLLHVVYAHDNFRTLSGSRMVMVQFQYRLIMKWFFKSCKSKRGERKIDATNHRLIGIVVSCDGCGELNS